MSKQIEASNTDIKEVFYPLRGGYIFISIVSFLVTVVVILGLLFGAFKSPSQLVIGFANLFIFGSTTIYPLLLILSRKPRLIIDSEGLVIQGFWKTKEIKWGACGPFSLDPHFYGVPYTKFSMWALLRDKFNLGGIDGAGLLGPDFRIPISIFGFNREAKATEFVAKVNALRLASLAATIKQDNRSAMSFDDYVKDKSRQGYWFFSVLFGWPLAIVLIDLLLDYLERFFA